MARAMKKAASNQVAVMESDMFAADAGVGVNDLGSEDLAIPFLKVLQKMSENWTIWMTQRRETFITPSLKRS